MDQSPQVPTPTSCPAEPFANSTCMQAHTSAGACSKHPYRSRASKQNMSELPRPTRLVVSACFRF